MFDGFFHPAFIGPGGPEILVVMLVLLVLFGAKDAPRMFRKLNDYINQIRRTAEHFRREIMYGDLSGETRSEHAVGDYDDYGLGSNGHADDDACLGGENEGSPEEMAEPICDIGADAEEGEGGDVHKA